MFTRTVLIPGQVADFENWLSANRLKRGYTQREIEEMLYIKDLSIQKMADEVAPINNDQEDAQELAENEEINPLNQAMEDREDSNEVHEQSPEMSLDKSDISANKSKSDTSANGCYLTPPLEKAKDQSREETQLNQQSTLISDQIAESMKTIEAMRSESSQLRDNMTNAYANMQSDLKQMTAN